MTKRFDFSLEIPELRQLKSVDRFKDCEESCSDEFGYGCNDNMEVTKLFAKDNEHRVSQCYHCRAHFSELLGSEHIKCNFETDIHNCPPYADASCGMAVNEHLENNILIRDEIRTCSSFAEIPEDCSVQTATNHDTGRVSTHFFQFDHACVCFVSNSRYRNHMDTLDKGDTYDIYGCKSSCSSDLCNDENLKSPREKHRCYHCTATMNSR